MKRRHLGQHRYALQAGSGERAQPSRGDVRHEHRRVGEHHIRFIGHHRDHRRAGAFIGYRRDVDARAQTKQLHRQRARRARAGQRPAQLAGIGLGVSRDILHAIERNAAARGQHIGHVGELGDGDEILHRIKRHFHQTHIHRHHRHRRHQQRVTIGVGLGHDLTRDHAARAAAIVIQNMLPDAVGKLARHWPRHHVGAAAGREGDHPADGFVGVGRFLRERADRGVQAKQQQHSRTFYPTQHGTSPRITYC